MHINLNNIGKRYQYEWIFKGISLDLQAGERLAILGKNGAGKSTLMKVLSGHLSPSQGKITFSGENGKAIDADEVFQKVSYAAPYIDLIEEFTLSEMVAFHQKFKPLREKNILDILGFSKNTAEKEIRFFSSGMKQRLKLALALCSHSDLILLDEPTTNLDTQGVSWYQTLIQEHTLPQQTIIVASNTEHDYYFCPKQLDILAYK